MKITYIFLVVIVAVIAEQPWRRNDPRDNFRGPPAFRRDDFRRPPPRTSHLDKERRQDFRHDPIDDRRKDIRLYEEYDAQDQSSENQQSSSSSKLNRFGFQGQDSQYDESRFGNDNRRGDDNRRGNDYHRDNDNHRGYDNRRGNHYSEESASRKENLLSSQSASSSSASKNRHSQQDITGNDGKRYLGKSSSNEREASSDQTSASSKNNRPQQSFFSGRNGKTQIYSESQESSEAKSANSQSSSSSSSSTKNSRSQGSFFPSDGRPRFNSFSQEEETKQEQSSSSQESSSSSKKSSSSSSFKGLDARSPRSAFGTGLRGSRLLDQDLIEEYSDSIRTPSGSSWASASSSKQSFNQLPNEESNTFSCSSTTAEGVYPLKKDYCSPFFVVCSTYGTKTMQLKFECSEQLYFDEKQIACKEKDLVAACKPKKVQSPPVTRTININNDKKPVTTLKDEPTISDIDDVQPIRQDPQFLCDTVGMMEDPSIEAQTQWGVCSTVWYHCPEINAIPEKRTCPANLYYDVLIDACELRDNIYSCTGIERLDETLSPNETKTPPPRLPTIIEHRRNMINSQSNIIPPTHPHPHRHSSPKKAFVPLSPLSQLRDAFTTVENINAKQSRENIFCMHHNDGKYLWDGVCSGEFLICNQKLGYVITCPDRMFFDPVKAACVTKTCTED